MAGPDDERVEAPPTGCPLPITEGLPVLAAELVRGLGVSLGLIVSALDVLGAQQALAPIEPPPPPRSRH
jgi:hypothetical protein